MVYFLEFDGGGGANFDLDVWVGEGDLPILVNEWARLKMIFEFRTHPNAHKTDFQN